MSARRVGELVGTTESSVYRWELRGVRPVPLMYERALKHLVIELAETRRGNGEPRPGKIAK